MVSIQLEKAVLKEKIMTCDDLVSFLQERDVDNDVIELISEFKEQLSKKNKNIKNPRKKSVKENKKRVPSFWNNYLKQQMPIVEKEQSGLKEGDDGWIDKEGRWKMTEIAKRWAIFKLQDNFKILEQEYKDSLVNVSSDGSNNSDLNNNDKNIKKKKKSNTRKESIVKPEPVNDSDDDDE